MGIGISLLLIAAGAVLVWAVDVSVSGVELVTVGWILLIVGAIGALRLRGSVPHGGGEQDERDPGRVGEDQVEDLRPDRGEERHRHDAH